jgi:hypothetical protein
MPFERYKADIDKLVQRAVLLSLAMHLEVSPDSYKKKLNTEQLKKIPEFKEAYQSWYSEALACVSQLLPNRREDFISYYKPLKARKSLDAENYTVSDYLRGLSANRGPQEVVGLAAALQPFEQQAKIVEALKQRFESSLFDIRALVQADLFDNELDAATELNNKGFQRAAGTVAGVVLEEHLATVRTQHQISMPRNASISKLNDLLKERDVIDVPTWRFVQRLGDLRNLCDHKRTPDPAVEDIDELVAGVKKVTKTLY